MKTNLIFGSIACLIAFASCNLDKVENPITNKFTKTYGAEGSYNGNDIKIAADGGYVIAGTSQDSVHAYYNQHAYLFKIANDGTFEWDKQFHTDVLSGAFGVLTEADGGFVLGGTKEDNDPDTYFSSQFLLKTNSGGTLIWSRVYAASPGAEDYEAYDFDHTSDGGYIISGTIYKALNTNNILLRKCDNLGNSLWEAELAVPNFKSRGRNIAATKDGGYIVGGRVTDATFASKMYLFKVNASGVEEWRKDLQIPGAISDIQQTEDGGYVLLGWEDETNNGEDYLSRLVKTNNIGEVVFNAVFDGPKWDFLTGVKQTADKGYILAGSTNGGLDNKDDVYLVKTDAWGNESWSKTLNFSGYDYASKVQITPDEGYIAVGSTTATIGVTPSKILVVKTDKDGNAQ